MNQYTIEALEYDKVLEQVQSYALCEQAKERIKSLKPSTDPDQIQLWMDETGEARKMLDINASVPLALMERIQEVFLKMGKGTVLNPSELEACKMLLESVKRIRRYMNSMEYTAPRLASYAASMYELEDLREEIHHAIINGRVDDHASSELNRIRRRMMLVQDRIKQKLSEIIRSQNYANILQEAVISERDGRYVVPVRRQFKKNFPGAVVDTSATGSTVFMEPSAVARFQDEMIGLKVEEEQEVYRILLALTAMTEGYARELSINVEAIAHYDFVFAKAKYSQALNMRAVSLNVNGHIVLNNARHPLLGGNAVPLNFYIGNDYRALLITGPNTGGKTVALKCVGLLTLMAQAGLHLPVGEGSQVAIFTDVLSDIGDGQNIEQSLSTFSAHLKNIHTIVKCAAPDTLVIIDEIGSGTDPAEGRGFAAAVLEEVYRCGATIIATTHFGELKDFADKTEGFENGCMEFDPYTLKPLYHLKIGEWGESQALLIALRLGMDPRIIERAHEISYGEKRDYSLNRLYAAYDIEDQQAIKQVEESRVLQGKRFKEKNRRQRKQKYHKKDLKIGDCVFISSMKRRGIVCEEENEKGDLLVMVMGKKLRINHKRLSLYVEAEDLYPENYDMDIVFETKEDRKKRKIMHKRHVEGLTIEIIDDSLDPKDI